MFTTCCRLGACHLRRLNAPTRRQTLCTTSSQPTLYDHLASRCTWFVHAGNCLILVAINQTDMLTLRELSVGASTCGIVYNLLQPKPLMVPAIWGTFFIGCHMWQIAALLRERQAITLSTDQDTAYHNFFCKYGFTAQQFLDVFAATGGKFETFAKGAWVQQRGEEMDYLHCVIEGDVQLIDRNGTHVRTVRPGKGGWLGEFYDPNQDADYWLRPHPAIVSWRCSSEQCRTLALQRRALHETISSNPRLTSAAERAEIADLWGKLKNSGVERNLSAYRGMLEVSLADGVITMDERQLLSQFRMRYAIPNDAHEASLRELGWTADDFVRGHKASSWWARVKKAQQYS
jgi:hypothetical protein